MAKGGALFSITESANAHKYIQRAYLSIGSVILLGLAGIAFICLLVVARPQISILIANLQHVTLVNSVAIIAGIIAVLLILLYPSSYRHVCYNRALKIHRNIYSKQNYLWIDAKDIERLSFKRAIYKDEAFEIVEIKYKALWMQLCVRFGISDPKDLEKFKSWASERGISVADVS